MYSLSTSSTGVLVHAVSCEGSVVFTQTHPAAPYGCRSGNITFSCQYDGVENVVVVLWVIGSEAGTANPSNISGHTALPRTTTYRELVVDSYTNLREMYHCSPVQSNGTTLKSNVHIPQIECKHDQSSCTKSNWSCRCVLRVIEGLSIYHLCYHILYIQLYNLVQPHFHAPHTQLEHHLFESSLRNGHLATYRKCL